MIHNVKLDSDKDGRQSKMAANSKSHAVSQTACGMKQHNVILTSYVKWFKDSRGNLTGKTTVCSKGEVFPTSKV